MPRLTKLSEYREYVAAAKPFLVDAPDGVKHVYDAVVHIVNRIYSGEDFEKSEKVEGVRHLQTALTHSHLEPCTECGQYKLKQHNHVAGSGSCLKPYHRFDFLKLDVD